MVIRFILYKSFCHKKIQLIDGLKIKIHTIILRINLIVQHTKASNAIIISMACTMLKPDFGHLDVGHRLF